jgi:hypothetical protein
LVKGVAQNNRTQNSHTVERRARPAHARTDQALFELLHFCWWQAGQNSADRLLASDPALQLTATLSIGPSQGQKKPERVSDSATGVLARRLTSGAKLARTSTHAQALLAGILGLAPAVTPSAPS